MKRLFSILAASMLTMAAMAQSQGLAFTLGYGQPTLREGLASGNSVGSYLLKGYGINNTTRYKGMQVGLMYEATIIKGFGAAFNLNYTFGINNSDWQKEKETLGKFPRSMAKMEFHTLELAVDWQYKFEVATNTYIIVYTGPTIGINVDGKTRLFKQDGIHDTHEWSLDPMSDTMFNPQSDDDGYGDFALRRYNLRWGIGAGFQYKRYFIRGGYDFGLINDYRNDQAKLASGDVANIKSRLDQWQIKLGIFFWQKD